MPFVPPFSALCREPGCLHAAGHAGYCSRHLASALTQRTLLELMDLLEEAVDGVIQEREPSLEGSTLLN